MMPSFSRVVPIIILYQHEMASHRNAVSAMQFPLLLERQTSRSRFKTESQNSYVEKIHSLHPPLLGRVEKLPSSLTFLSVVRQSTEIELCKIEPFQSRAFQLCCERRLTPSACLSQVTLRLGCLVEALDAPEEMDLRPWSNSTAVTKLN